MQWHFLKYFSTVQKQNVAIRASLSCVEEFPPTLMFPAARNIDGSFLFLQFSQRPNQSVQSHGGSSASILQVSSPPICSLQSLILESLPVASDWAGPGTLGQMLQKQKTGIDFCSRCLCVIWGLGVASVWSFWGIGIEPQKHQGSWTSPVIEFAPYYQLLWQKQSVVRRSHPALPASSFRSGLQTTSVGRQMLRGRCHGIYCRPALLFEKDQHRGEEHIRKARRRRRGESRCQRLQQLPALLSQDECFCFSLLFVHLPEFVPLRPDRVSAKCHHPPQGLAFNSPGLLHMCVRNIGSGNLHIYFTFLGYFSLKCSFSFIQVIKNWLWQAFPD